VVALKRHPTTAVQFGTSLPFPFRVLPSSILTAHADRHSFQSPCADLGAGPHSPSLNHFRRRPQSWWPFAKFSPPCRILPLPHEVTPYTRELGLALAVLFSRWRSFAFSCFHLSPRSIVRVTPLFFFPFFFFLFPPKTPWVRVVFLHSPLHPLRPVHGRALTACPGFAFLSGLSSDARPHQTPLPPLLI